MIKVEDAGERNINSVYARSSEGSGNVLGKIP